MNIEEFLDNFGRNRGGGDKGSADRYSFNPNYVTENAKSEKIPLQNLPAPVKSKLDYLAARVLDTDNNTTVVMGSPFAGKSFLIEQLAYNIDEYTSKNNTGGVIFIKLSEVDVVKFTQAAVLQKVMEEFVEKIGAKAENICFVTEAPEVAIYISTVLPKFKIILEINTDNFMDIARSSQRANSKIWGNWQLVDANELYCTREELIELLEISVLAKSNKNFKKEISKRQLKSFITYAINRMENAIQEDNGRMVVVIPPGVWATVFRHIANDYAYNTDEEFLHSNGNVNFNKIMKRTFQDTSDLFSSFAEDDGEGNGGEISPEDLLRMITEGGGTTITGIVAGPPGMMAGMNGSPNTPKKDIQPLVFKDITNLEERLHSDIVGQDSAVKKVSESIIVPAAGLSDPKKPIRSFLFLGPTGVGKTQLALDLAKEVSDKPLNVVRIDMSEYQQEHEVAKLFGAPPGYVGYEQGGALTNAVLENPQSIVLLDEVEKAHPKVWDSFLQVFDAGRMTDSKGEEIDFSQTIVIMTSNIGAQEVSSRKIGLGNFDIKAPAEIGSEETKEQMMKELEKLFKRELINRIDEIVIFDSLTKNIASTIVNKEFQVVRERLSSKGYNVGELDEEIIDSIITKSDIVKFGARDIQRSILRNISNPIAHHIVKNTGDKNIKLSLADNEIKITSSK